MRLNSTKVRCSPQAAAWIKAYADKLWRENEQKMRELGHRRACNRYAVDMLIKEYEEMKKRTARRQ